LVFQKGNMIGEESRFKPGQSGNPSGRPKSIAKLVTERLNAPRDDGTTLADQLVEELLNDARSEDTSIRLPTRRELLSRIYPAVSKHALESDPDSKLEISWKSSGGETDSE